MPSHRENVVSAFNMLAEKNLDICHKGIVSMIDRSQEKVVFSKGWDCDSIFGNTVEIGLHTQLKDPIAAAHLELYKQFPTVGSIIICQPKWCTIWAQLGEPIPPTGILHAEHFYGVIPCTNRPEEDQVAAYYPEEIARSIKNALGSKTVKQMPALLLRYVGAVVLADTALKAVDVLDILETVAMLAWQIRLANGDSSVEYLSYAVLNKHHCLVHGEEDCYLRSLERTV